MKQEITMQYQLYSADWWKSKTNGVILTDSQTNLGKIYHWLVEQDDYWKGYLEVIQVYDFTKPIKDYYELRQLCEYVGKTDINNIEDFYSFCEKENIPVFVYWYNIEY